jgi:hypothetical protein
MNLVLNNADITFSEKGCINLPASTIHKLNIEEGDLINIWTDGMEYYLYVQEKAPTYKRGLICRSRSKGTMRAFSVELSDKMRNGARLAGYSVGEKTTIDIGCKKVEALPIITRRNLYGN